MSTAANRPAKWGLRRWAWIGVSLAAIWIATAALLLVINWPFTEATVTKTLEDRFAREVRIRKFARTYFPPGCVAQGIEFLHRQRKDLPPLITVETLALRATYSGLLSLHKQISHVEIAGLHVTVPPKSKGGMRETFPLTNSVSGKTIGIGEINTDNAVLEFLPKEAGGEHFILRIDHLTLDHVGESGPLAFHARFKNTEPPGNVRTDGQIGPWNDDDPGSTELSGTYTYDHVNLGTIGGVAGTLASKGKFGGQLGRLQAEGEVDVPDFKVKGSKHSVHLASNYHAVVDGTNGDTSLTRVESHFGNTTVITQGEVKGHPGGHGKTATLGMTVNHGRIEDLLRMFSSSLQPAEVGEVRVRMQVELPPAPPEFLRRLRLSGDFGIGGAHFTDAKVQLPVNRLAESAQGEKKDREKNDPTTVLSNLKGHVSAKDGIASLSNVSFTEPGTLAEVHGTYNLVNKYLNLHGVLHTNGKLADTSGGFKSAILKALTPFLKKKTVTVVPFAIKGTSSDPTFTLDVLGKR